MEPLRESLFDIGPPPACSARFNMAAHTLAAARATPAKTALIVTAGTGEVTERWSFAELEEAVRRTAGGLRAAGIAPGDRVLLRIANSSDFPIAFFGTVAVGAIAVPSSTELTPGELARLIAETKPALLLYAGVAPPEAPCPVLPAAALREAAQAEMAETSADDPAFLVATSGTGGQPKGVLHAHRAAHARRMMWAGWFGLGAADRVLHAGAFNWTYTLGAGLTDPWAAGATAIIHTGAKTPDLWPRLLSEQEATIFAAVPGVFRQMLRAPLPPLPALRHGLTAGEKLHAEVRAGWEAATGTALYEALGMSEVSTYISASPEVPVRPGTSGRPQAGRRVAILAEHGPEPVPIGTLGRLAVHRRDPGLMLGYWQRPEETAAAFDGDWFVTGDRAEMDAEGYVTYHGRLDDVLTAQGFRIAPLEIEEALAAHPGVAEAAALEVEVRAGVRIIVALYVPAGPADHESLSALCAARLARYKCPREFRATGRLPRTANGKLIRRALPALWAETEAT
ncbi:MAG: AMP-binding protein [Pseudomonadota bacterium]